MNRRPRRVKGLRILRRLTPSGPGFLTLERYLARNLYEAGGASRPYRFEVVHRRGLDAVAVIPYFFKAVRDGGKQKRRKLMVVFKIGFRPGMYLRSKMHPPEPDRRKYTYVLEAVAGSIEPGDDGARGIDARARAELLEETGMKPREARLIRLGSGFFPSHGQSTEKVHLRACAIDPVRASMPIGDGSVNEDDSGTFIMEAGRLLEGCRKGMIEDPKLEIGVTRLCRLLSYRTVRALR